jgi:hypothetical protein
VFTAIEREHDIRMSEREEHEIFLLSGGAYSTSLLKRMEENALRCVREQIF